MKKFIAWTIIVLIVSLVCAIAGSIVLLVTNNFNAAFSVAFFGGIVLYAIISL